MSKKEEIKERNFKEQETLEIKLKVLDIIKGNINSKLDTINKIDGKVGILSGFYFLAFIEIINYIKNKYFFLILFVFVFSFAVYFLVKNFWLKDLKYLYLNLKTYLPHKGGLDYDGYIRELEKQYNDIEKEIDNSIKERRNDLKTSIILFCISLSIFVLSYLIKGCFILLINHY